MGAVLNFSFLLFPFSFQTHVVQSNRHIVNIALVGFMGTGKTSVGRLVAEQLRFHYLDTDEMIQSATGKTISEIFSALGEPAFRALEEKIVGELAGKSQSVISCGGGLTVAPHNLASLKTHALVVCLWASPAKIWERVKNQTHRPLLHDPDPQNKIRELLAAREPFYKQADILLNTESRSLREVAQQVIHQFRLQASSR
jgi:shikimate kinase